MRMRAEEAGFINNPHLTLIVVQGNTLNSCSHSSGSFPYMTGLGFEIFSTAFIRYGWFDDEEGYALKAIRNLHCYCFTMWFNVCKFYPRVQAGISAFIDQKEDTFFLLDKDQDLKSFLQSINQ